VYHEQDSRKRKPAATVGESHVQVCIMNRTQAMSAGKVGRTPTQRPEEQRQQLRNEKLCSTGRM